MFVCPKQVIVLIFTSPSKQIPRNDLIKINLGLLPNHLQIESKHMFVKGINDFVKMFT